MSAPKWPESVPVLTAKDIHRGSMHSPDGGRHCLMGHAVLHFKDWRAREDVWPELIAAVGKRGGLYVADFNDDPANTKTAIANVWNETMRSLGYTEIHEVDA